MDCNVPDSPVQDVGLTVIQQQQRQAEGLADHLAYWRQQLGGAPLTLELPTDRPRSPIQSLVSSQHSFVLPQALSTALKTLSRQEGATFFTMLLAAWQLLLHRYSGQDDLLVGTPMKARTPIGEERINLLVLRVRIVGNPTFRELLGHLRQVVTEAEAHQVPFEQVVQVLQFEPNPNRHPLFQVMFALEQIPPEEDELTPSPRYMKVDNGITKLDLALLLRDGRQELRGWFEYNADLFEAETIARLAGHFQSLLEAIVVAPDERLSQLSLLATAEQQQLLVEWNATQHDYPTEQCLHHLVEAQVERTPDATAIVFEHEQLSYQQLNQRANQLAHYLRQLGVGPEVRVGICVERSVEMIVGLLGILKAGGAYVPLDPSYPAERLAFMLANAQTGILLTQQRLLNRLPAHQTQVLCLDSRWPQVATQPITTPSSTVTPDNLAYVIYTSGSTGIPRGVMMTHRALVNRVFAMAEMYELDEDHRVLQFLSLSFDASVEEIFPTLTAGATLILHRNPAELLATELLLECERLKITLLHMPSAYWHQMVDELSSLQRSVPASVRTTIVGGESPSMERLVAWSRLAKHPTKFMNVYGPTEAAITSTRYETSVELAVIGKLKQLPIGRPIANTEIYVLDSYLRPVPIGVPGELYIGGAGLARGYLARPELTAEKFIPNPFSAVPGARLYKTGDLARYLPDGNLQFLGRLDHQVKLRGYRIELGEIESVLSQHPSVRECIVLAREDTPGDKRLVAYIVRNVVQSPVEAQAQGGELETAKAEEREDIFDTFSGQEHISQQAEKINLRVWVKYASSPVHNISPDELIAQLQALVKEKLPDYMLPSAFVLLETLPLTSNGKLDRRALPAPKQTHPTLQSTFVRARTPIEETIVAIWSQVLGIEQVGIHDNFFALGGHSLRAMQVLSRLRAIFQVEVPLHSFLEAPTVSQLAELLQQHQASGTKSHMPSLRPISREAYRVPSLRQREPKVLMNEQE